MTANHFGLTLELRCLCRCFGGSFGKHTFHLAFEGFFYFMVLKLVQRIVSDSCWWLSKLLKCFTLSKLTFWFFFFPPTLLRYISPYAVPYTLLWSSHFHLASAVLALCQGFLSSKWNWNDIDLLYVYWCLTLSFCCVITKLWLPLNHQRGLTVSRRLFLAILKLTLRRR